MKKRNVVIRATYPTGRFVNYIRMELGLDARRNDLESSLDVDITDIVDQYGVSSKEIIEHWSNKFQNGILTFSEVT